MKQIKKLHALEEQSILYGVPKIQLVYFENINALNSQHTSIFITNLLKREVKDTIYTLANVTGNILPKPIKMCFSYLKKNNMHKKILDIKSYLPKNGVSLSKMAQTFDYKLEYLKNKIGFSFWPRLDKGKGVSEMAYEAAKKLKENNPEFF